MTHRAPPRPCGAPTSVSERVQMACRSNASARARSHVAAGGAGFAMTEGFDRDRFGHS
jgi:hypothetical protein